MLIFNLIRSSAFISVNKDLMRAVGINAALLLSELASKRHYFEERGQLTSEGYFFCTSENIEQDTCLSYKLQAKALKGLREHGLIETKVMGQPAKKYFRFTQEHEENLKDLMGKTSIAQREKLEITNGQNINKNKEIKDIHTQEEARESLSMQELEEKKNNIPAKPKEKEDFSSYANVSTRIVNFYQKTRGWKLNGDSLQKQAQRNEVTRTLRSSQQKAKDLENNFLYWCKYIEESGAYAFANPYRCAQGLIEQDYKVLLDNWRASKEKKKGTKKETTTKKYKFD